MERIVYRKTLDVHKNGIQFTLQGFETADNMSRRIELSLMASGDTIDLPLEQLKAIMYVTTPNSTEPSINDCTIKDNVIIYDVLPIVEEGITEMQLKLIGTDLGGASGVLMSPRFAVEVSLSGSDDGSATQTTTYTALENALAKASGVYDARLEGIELDENCIFRAIYADGTVYESNVLAETVLKGEAILSQSYARGGTGIRDGENIDNSKHYSNVAKSESLQSSKAREETEELLDEVKNHSIYTVFAIDFKTGTIKYESQQYSFEVNEETGDLDIIGDSYTPSADVEQIVKDWLASLKNAYEKRLYVVEDELDSHSKNIADNTTDINEIKNTLPNVSEHVTKCENDIDKCEKDISSLASDVSNNYKEIFLVKTDLSNTKSTINTANNRIAQNESDIRNLLPRNAIQCRRFSGTTNENGNLTLNTDTSLIPICCVAKGFSITPYLSRQNLIMGHVTTVEKVPTAVCSTTIDGVDFYYIDNEA